MTLAMPSPRKPHPPQESCIKNHSMQHSMQRSMQHSMQRGAASRQDPLTGAVACGLGDAQPTEASVGVLCTWLID